MNRIALVAVALAALAGPAAAGNAVVLPALGCQTGYAEGQTTYSDDGRLYNDSATWWRTALCPVSTPVGTTSVSVQVSVLDMNYTLDVSCRIMAAKTDGSTFWGPAYTSTGTSTKLQTVTVGFFTGPAAPASYVLCYIPQTYSSQRSAIAYYASTAATN